MTEREIFFEALEMATPEARAAYLQRACTHDVTLLRKVEALLKEHFSDDSLMAGPAMEAERTEVESKAILARPVSQVEKTWRWCRRKPAVAALAAATILLLMAVAIGSPIAAWRIATARDAERQERQRAQGNANELVKSLYVADMRMAWQALQEDNLLLARESVYKYLPALGIPGSQSKSSDSPQGKAEGKKP